MSYAQVALPLPLRQTFTYRVPDALASDARPGAQVVVPFRGGRKRGFLVALDAAPPAGAPAESRLLDMAEVLGAPVFTPHLLTLASWIAAYYVAPMGEVLAAALPGGLEGFAKSRGRRAAAENPVVEMALPERVRLTDGQRKAVGQVERAVADARFAPLLLHGVTGSGKTEVYMRGARAARDQGGQTLVLVPEVALGSQLVATFRARFGGRVGVLHSYLGVGERRRTWELARRGALDVIVGARSAVFAPLPALRLIVVDEEHEPAYKQSEQLRYHGRDTAVRRAQLLGIPVVLGSATPSLESLANASRGKYRCITLPERVDRRPMPRVHVVDMRRERTPAMLSRPLHAALADRIERGEQSLLFLNRRGHSHHAQCRQCGWVPECPHCDITLTLHVAPNAWRCHYCDHREAASARCPDCHAALMRFGGAGTQRVERELASALPGARVMRLDTDVARDRAKPADVLRRFARGEADILLGTQMVAKGLDFPNVTLVGVLDADVALHLPDFRAAERTFQLLVQVSGRAGRGRTPGEVYVQTATPEHPAVAAAVLGDARAFQHRELAERRGAGYPPYTRLATLLFSGKDPAQVEAVAAAHAERARAAASPAGAQPAGVLALSLEASAERLLAEPLARGNEAAREARGVEPVHVLGPAPRAIARLRGLHRWHVLLKGSDAHALRAVIEAALAASERANRGVRVTVDVDPVEVL